MNEATITANDRSKSIETVFGTEAIIICETLSDINESDHQMGKNKSKIRSYLKRCGDAIGSINLSNSLVGKQCASSSSTSKEVRKNATSHWYVDEIMVPIENERGDNFIDDRTNRICKIESSSKNHHCLQQSDSNSQLTTPNENDRLHDNHMLLNSQLVSRRQFSLAVFHKSQLNKFGYHIKKIYEFFFKVQN